MGFLIPPFLGILGISLGLGAYFCAEIFLNRGARIFVVSGAITLISISLLHLKNLGSQ